MIELTGFYTNGKCLEKMYSMNHINMIKLKNILTTDLEISRAIDHYNAQDLVYHIVKAVEVAEIEYLDDLTDDFITSLDGDQLENLAELLKSKYGYQSLKDILRI